MRGRRGKYNARPTTVDGYKFQSGIEATRYGELVLLQRAGEIADLIVHPPYVLQEAFRDNEGNIVEPITYVADFAYIENGRQIVEDVKGGKATQTDLFKVKAKMFKKRYIDMYLIVVER